MRKSLLVAAIVVAALILTVGSWAQTTPPCEKGHGAMKAEKGAGKHFAKAGCIFDTSDLGLSDEQKAKTDAIRTEAKSKCQDVGTKMKEVNAQLQTLWQADEPDAATIKEKVRELSDLKTKMMEQHVDFALQMKQVLTKEQWSKVQQSCPSGLGCCGYARGEGQGECPMMGAGKMMHHGKAAPQMAPAEKTQWCERLLLMQVRQYTPLTH